MTKYGNNIKQAQAAIKKAGQLVTWRKQVKTANVNQPWKATDLAPQDFEVSMVFLKGGFTRPLFVLLKGSDVTEGAPDAIMAGGLPFTPEETDVIIQNGVTLAIESIDVLQPDGTPILYYIRLQ